MPMFDDYYSSIVSCLDQYLGEKNDRGWAQQVKTFKQDTLPAIAKLRNILRLHNDTQKFCNSLRSPVNWLSGGLLGGSQLKNNLEKILIEMLSASERAISLAEEGKPPCASESPPAVLGTEPVGAAALLPVASVEVGVLSGVQSELSPPVSPVSVAAAPIPPSPILHAARTELTSSTSNVTATATTTVTVPKPAKTSKTSGLRRPFAKKEKKKTKTVT